MEHLIWMLSPTPDPPMVEQVGKFSGSYVTEINGSECVLKLWFDGGGFVHEAFTSEGETLDIRGGISGRTGALHGFLLEPYNQVPIAMFSAEVSLEGLSLQVGVPEFEDLLQVSRPERLELSRVQDWPDLSEIWENGERLC